MVLYESIAVTCADLVLCSVPTLLAGFSIHLKACVVDIILLFERLDRISKFFQRSKLNNSGTLKCKISQSSKCKSFKLPQRDNTESEMLELCKEIVDLHQKVYRYYSCSGNLFVNCSQLIYFRLLHGLADVMNAFILQTVMILAVCTCLSLLVIVKVTKRAY